MNFQTKVSEFSQLKSEYLVVGAVSGSTQTSAFTALDKSLGGILTPLLDSGDIKTEFGKAALIPGTGNNIKRVLVVGLGETGGLTRAQMQKLATTVAKQIRVAQVKSATLALDDVSVADADKGWCASMLARAISLSGYRYTATKSAKVKPQPLKTITVLTADKTQVSAVRKGLEHGAAIGEGMNLARELGDLPGNICTPAYLAKQARSLARNQTKLSVKILKEKEMRELGMGSLLSVSAGSDEEAHLIIMEYKGAAKTAKPHVLVGKGITFDTGGISLKPGAGMDEMKFDMCGAASVFGTMKTLLELQPNINVVGVVAASENMPNGHATKPGDIVTSMSGQTIEVLNTDAEGRLVLCDALTYVERYKPATVIDIATLTGACIVALGRHTSGLYSNSDTFAKELQGVSEQVCDAAWHMPMGEEYDKQLDSNFADMANIGGPPAGSITAACFLARFTKAYTWAHLDIAGVANLTGAAKGATGRPVPLLAEYLLTKAGR